MNSHQSYPGPRNSLQSSPEDPTNDLQGNIQECSPAGLEKGEGGIDLSKTKTAPEAQTKDKITVEKTDRESSQEGEESDPDLVTWDGPEDPTNPRNWSIRRRHIITVLVSLFNVVGPLSSSILAPALPTMRTDLDTSDTISTMILSIYMLAFSFGPLLTSPLSEMYGRVPVLQGGNAFFLVFNTACGFVKTPGQMLSFRFLAGIGGCAAQSIGGALLGDMFTPLDRGTAVSIYSVAPLAGTVVGILAGGALTQYAHWSWCFWVISILGVLVQLAGLAFLPETYAPVLLQKKRNRLVKETGNENLKTEFEGSRSWEASLAKNLKRPFDMLGTQPIVQIMSIYQGYSYGLAFMLSATMAMVYEGVYNQKPATASLNFLPSSISVIIISQINPRVGNLIYKRLTCARAHPDIGNNNNNNCPKAAGRPEYRLPLLLPATLSATVGLLWYGWSAQQRLSVVMPNIGTVLVTAGTTMQFYCVNQYLLDTYRLHAASALAATTIFRGVCGFGIPLLAPPLFDVLGVGMGMTILAIGAAGVGVPGMFIVWRWGQILREKSLLARR